MPSDEEDRLNDRLMRMESKLDHLRELMDGGANPAAGMIVRIDRLEQNHASAVQQRATIWAAIVALFIALIGSLAGVVFGIWLHYK